MTLQEQVEKFLDISEELKRQIDENTKLRIQYLTIVINLLLEARNQHKEPRLHKIDQARALLEEWKASLIEEKSDGQ